MTAAKPWPLTLAQVKDELETLTKMLHYKKLYKEMPADYLLAILTRQASPAPHNLLHPNQSIAKFITVRMTRAIRTGIRISAIFVTLPSLIDSLRSSTNSLFSLKTWKDILSKFVRSVLYIALFSAIPSIIISLFSKLGVNIIKSKLQTFISVLIGGTIGFIVETPYRHFQFLGYFTPKAIETIFNILARKGYY